MSLRSISWPALSELVVRTEGDTSVEAMRAFCADAGTAWALEAIEHMRWLLEGEIDPRCIAVRAGVPVGSSSEARRFVVALRTSLEAAIAMQPMRTPPPPRDRFVALGRAHGGGRVRNRRIPRTDRTPSADFLGRMFALFGPPRVVQYEGFSYSVRDTARDLAFEAYVGPTGPAYGAPLVDHDVFATQRHFAPTLDAFDRLLDDTPLADCRVTFEKAWELWCEGGRPRERWRDP